ncbi:quinone oxidoreductase 2 [Podospora aff. communis PSN243]|uniref:Quinone oxidoreductase 2 n=1 Tax=Podospora aff. communis PSN243 TaxID=3040156 RepID=A0AAV9GF36_9PEZI|nr:quinone oxidoreductase 2 [Podospora aff. communis PSN243]
MKTLGIFPASGALGTSTSTHLLRDVPANHVVLISRHPEKTPQVHVQAGVGTRQADYSQSPAELKSAFSGIDILFLISYPSHQHKLRTELHRKAIAAADRAGVRHIFYSSLAFAGVPPTDTSVAEVMGAHLDSEAYLRELAEKDEGLSYTIVRQGLYSESTPIYTAFFDPTPNYDPKAEEWVKIHIPHHGGGPGVSWVKRDELGEANAALIARYLLDKERFERDWAGWVNGTVVFTGSKAWRLDETVEVLEGVANKRLIIIEVSVDEYVAQPEVLAVFGSEELARTWATAWEAIKKGETAAVTSDLEVVLGRKPEDFHITVAERRA